MEVTTVSPSPASPTEGDDLCERDVTDVAIHSVTLLICLCGLAGNGAVICLLSLESGNSAIFDVAVSDFFFLLFMVPCALLFLVEDMSCSLIVPSTYMSFLFELSLLSYYWALYALILNNNEVAMYKLVKLRCHFVFPKVIWTLLGQLQFRFVIALLRDDSQLTFLCPSHKRENCRAAFFSVFTIIMLFFAALMVISRTILFMKAEHGSKKQHPKRRDIVTIILVLFTLLFGPCIFLQQISYILLPFRIFFLLTCIYSSIKPLIYFMVGKCWSPCSMQCIQFALQRVFEDKKEQSTTEMMPPVTWESEPVDPFQCSAEGSRHRFP